MKQAQTYLELVQVIIVALTIRKSALINRKGREFLVSKLRKSLENWFDFSFQKPKNIDKISFSKITSGEIQSFEQYENSIVNKAGEEILIVGKYFLYDNTEEIIGTLSAGRYHRKKELRIN